MPVSQELDSKLHWYKDAIFYELHIKAFYDGNEDGIGDFSGMLEKLDYLEELGITTIWLLPFYPSPLKDDGYDIADYYSINPAYGEIKEFQKFLQEAHRRHLKVITELVRHSVAEEMYLYPAARKAIPGGDQLADREIEEHAAAEQVMKDLEKVAPEDPRFDQLLAQLITDIRGHVADEETDLFPRLQAACSEQELVELGEKVRRAKKVAPTRPHPSAPDTPPANKVLGPAVGLVDRIRDALTGRPH